jgi:hypothetical protein
MATTINDYLGELERQLRVRCAPRTRLLREVEDHLRELVDELAVSGLAQPDAEARAIARFGAAAAVAARFAEAAASTTTHRAASVATGALGAYVATFCAFATAASPLVNDFPQGAASFFGIQLAAVAIAFALARSLRWRREAAAPRAELAVLARSLALACGALAASALAEAALALTRPAGIVVWSEARWLILGFAAAVATVLVSALAAARAAAQAAAVGAFLPVVDGRQTPAAVMLRDDLRVLGARLRLRWPLPIAALDPLRHPWRLTLLIAALAFAGVTAVPLAGGGAQHASVVASAAALGMIEAAAIIVGFAAFGRFLGLRDRAAPAAD